MIKGVIFDMDGVLLDSEQLTAEASVMMFREKGFEVKENDFYQFLGMGERGYLGGVAQMYNIPFELDKDRIRTYTIYSEIVKGKLFPLAGVSAFFKKCRDKKLKIAVGTSADKMKMQINLDAIGFPESFFDATVNGRDVSKNKPDPEIFLKAAEKLGLKPQECLVVEDAITGVAAAKTAGCKCLGLLSYFSAKELSKADWIAKSLKEAPEEVLNW
jgi:beta-phosphoglucomutase